MISHFSKRVGISVAVMFLILPLFVSGQIYDSQIGATITLGQFRYVSCVAKDPSGNFFVADNNSNIITKFNSSGTPILSFGGPGSATGLFNNPLDIETDAGGNVYVADTGNNRIQVFDNTGSFKFTWGSPGTNDGQFGTPTGIAIDGSGNVFVVESQGNRVQEFSSSGAFIRKWGSAGSANGQFQSPIGIETDGSGNVYVADFGGNRIQKFSSTGTFTLTWGTAGNNDGQFNLPWDIKISGTTAYVSDAGNNRVQAFDLSGNFLFKWGSYGDLNGQLQFAEGIEINGVGNVYVCSGGRIDIFSSSGSFVSRWTGDLGNGQFYSPSSVATDAGGNIYVVDNSQVQKFSPTGNFLSMFGTKGTGNGQFSGASAIAIDASGNIFVADGSRIQKFDNTGTFLLKWGSSGSVDGQFFQVTDIAFDANGNVYITDFNNGRVQKFSSTGNFLAKIGTQGTGDGQLNYPMGLAVDATGNIYVTDQMDRVQKFSSAGAFILKLGSNGNSDGQFVAPRGVRIDGSGNLYVVDASNNRVQKFNSSGSFISKFGSGGTATGQFNFPGGITFNNDGSLYVCDALNFRVQKFVFTSTITNIQPSLGFSGATVTITGTNFSKTPVNNIVKFNGTAATVTASTATSLTVTVPPGATTGSVTVTVAGQTGTSGSSFVVDNAPVAVATNTTPDKIVRGQDLTATVTFSLPPSGLSSAKIQYRTITDGPAASFTTKDLTASGSSYTAVIPAAAITELGVEYKLLLTNGAGLDNSSSQPTYKTIINHTAGLALSSYPSNAAGTSASSYRMISIPLTLVDKTTNGIFSDEIGSYDPTAWRMFKYNGSTFDELNGSSTVVPGEGYWFIAVSSSPLNTGPGTTVDATAGNPFSITLKPGWNQIGNPYNFNISMSDIVAANPSQATNLGGSTAKFRIFRGAVDNQDVLKSMEGGFVKFLGSTPTPIKIPTAKNSGIQGRVGTESPVNSNFDNPAWEIPFTLKSGDLEYKIGGVGMHPEAKDGFDYHDDFNAPRFLDYLEIKFPKKYAGMTYSKDVVPTRENYSWSFNVESNVQSKTAVLQWDNSTFGSGKEIYLLDVRTHKIVDMARVDHYEFSQTGSSEFKVVYGTQAFTKEELLPNGIVLHEPYPNPFLNELRIDFALPTNVARDGAQIEIFNSIGAVLSVTETFQPGEGSLQWDGGQHSAGMYLVRLKSGSQVVTKRIIKR